MTPIRVREAEARDVGEILRLRRLMFEDILEPTNEMRLRLED